MGGWRASENRSLRVFRLEEVTGRRRRLHNEKLHKLFSSENIVRMMN
jgi:hypothetical protein